MSDDRPADGPASTPAGDAELRDAMESIEAIGEDWRSTERATEHDTDKEDGDERPEEG